MKILNVIPDDRIGGPQRRIAGVAVGLKKLGIETIVAMPDRGGNFPQFLEQLGIECVRVPSLQKLSFSLHVWSHIKYAIFFIPSILRLRRIIRNRKIDILHQNSIWGVQGPLAAKTAGTKVVWHLNGITFRLAARRLTFFPYFLADTIVAASRRTGTDYFSPGALFSRPFKTLYAPVDTRRFRPRGKSQSVLRQYKLENDQKVVGMVGNLNPIKGHLFFVQAAAMVQKKMPGVKFLIVGGFLGNRSGYEKAVLDEIEKLGLKDDCIFTGFIDNVAETMSVMDVFVLSSVTEACPIVLLEAVALEIPSVATDVGGVPEIIADGETGFIVPAKDSSGIADRIHEFLQMDEGRKKAMTGMGRAHVVEQFDLEKCVERHATIYEELADHGENRNEDGNQPHR